ncbi:MAG: ABC transporter ATP-binding protein, partial [Candidatus Edwardsbacteria bacterium]|nr:ABC transporter ATP-binding protein [Candidatus Edwardsbacteria bacterium]
YRDLIKTHSGLVLLVILLQVSIDCLFNALPLYTKHFIDVIVPVRSLVALLRFTGLLFANMAGIIGFQYIINRFQEKVRLTLTFALDNQVLVRILNAPVQLLSQKPGSFHANRIKQDTDEVIGFYQYFVCQFVSNVATAIWVIIYALTINVWIAVVMATVFFPLYMLVRWYYNRLRGRIFAVRDQHCDIETFRYETLAGLRSLKLWLAHRFRMAVYSSRYNEYMKSSVSLSVSEFYPSLIQEAFIEYLPQLGVFLLGGYMVFQGKMTIGQWMALSLYANSFVGPMSRVANIGGKFSVVSGTIERLKEYTTLPEEIDEAENPEKIPSNIENLRIDDISYEYPDKTRAVENVSFELSRGEVCAIVGGSGAGKSTVVNIIAGLFTPQTGNCSLNGIPYRALPVSYIRSKIAVASISDFIFSESIADNIGLARKQAEPEAIKRASGLAAAQEFISDTEKGYDTRLGEGGLGLSDGQIQRIILARLFLKGGDVVILDEATASLDPETERKVLTNVMEVFRGKIILFVTHHPSVAKHAQRILVLENGTIVDSGRHEELIFRNQYYRELMQRGIRHLPGIDE